MKDIELPPLPEPDICRYVVTVWRDGVECEIDNGPRYTVEQMQSYARAAVESDRAQRVPDVEAHDELMALAERIEEARGRSICVMPEFAKVLRTLLASTPAQPAQQTLPEAMETVIAEMQSDPDYAWAWHCNVAMAMVDAGCDPVKANQGAARFMRVLANVEPAHELPSAPAQPAQQGKAAFCHEKDAQMPTLAEMAAAHQEPPQQERKPPPNAPTEVEKLMDAAGLCRRCAEPTDTRGVKDVLAERQRQISAEGWTPEHDDEHKDGSLSVAAACYALTNVQCARPGALSTTYLATWVGWGSGWFKPTYNRRRDLVKAGALILAEIERLDRAERHHGIKE